MIKKIESIKNLAVFDDEYKQDKELPDFKKYNLIYGWNSSGKTTLSKILESGKSEEFDDDKKSFCCSSEPWTYRNKNDSKVCKGYRSFEFGNRRENIFCYF